MACGPQKVKSLSKRPMKHSLCAFSLHKHDFQSIYEHLTVGLDFVCRIINGKIFPYCRYLTTNKLDASSQKCLRVELISRGLHTLP